jgi:hypothetical protein
MTILPDAVARRCAANQHLPPGIAGFNARTGNGLTGINNPVAGIQYPFAHRMPVRAPVATNRTVQ